MYVVQELELAYFRIVLKEVWSSWAGISCGFYYIQYYNKVTSLIFKLKTIKYWVETNSMYDHEMKLI